MATAARGTKAPVLELPDCDFCGHEATYDGVTSLGPWANMCQKHFGEFGLGLGLGVGQKLILAGGETDGN